MAGKSAQITKQQSGASCRPKTTNVPPAPVATPQATKTVPEKPFRLGTSRGGSFTTIEKFNPTAGKWEFWSVY